MRKGLFYICLLLVGVGLFAGCKSKKAVVASFSDLDGEWGVVEMNGKTLNPEETHQVLVFDVPRFSQPGERGRRYPKPAFPCDDNNAPFEPGWHMGTKTAAGISS